MTSVILCTPSQVTLPPHSTQKTQKRSKTGKTAARSSDVPTNVTCTIGHTSSDSSPFLRCAYKCYVYYRTTSSDSSPFLRCAYKCYVYYRTHLIRQQPVPPMCLQMLRVFYYRTHLIRQKPPFFIQQNQINIKPRPSIPSTNQCTVRTGYFSHYQNYTVVKAQYHNCKFHCFTVHFVSLSFIYTNVCTCF